MTLTLQLNIDTKNIEETLVKYGKKTNASNIVFIRNLLKKKEGIYERVGDMNRKYLYFIKVDNKKEDQKKVIDDLKIEKMSFMR